MKQRNAFAVAAHFRKAASFHHKCEARGGAKNTQREIMSDVGDDSGDLSPFWENVEAMEGDKLLFPTTEY
jgi:hypothetical protein